MGIASVLFHWSPSTFWRATPHEYWAAYEGWRTAHPKKEEH